VRTRGERDRYVLAAGITASGTVQFGNMREIMIPELVARALRRLGALHRRSAVGDSGPSDAAAELRPPLRGVFEQQMARLGIEPEWSCRPPPERPEKCGSCRPLLI
jgi:lysyl-tRNA synthetase class I